MRSHDLKKALCQWTAILALAVSGAVWVVNGVDFNQSPEVFGTQEGAIRVPKEQDRMPPNYVNQPPMIPRSVEDCQVTTGTSRCLQCHGIESYRTTGVPYISPTRFMDSSDKVGAEVAPRHYFCLQCHVPQADTTPIMGNTLTPSEGYGEQEVIVGNSDREPGLIKRLWKWWRTPSHLALGMLLLIGLVGGIVSWGGFNTGIEKANIEEFCISCHEMHNTVYWEYMDSAHYNDRSGIRATCPGRHVPHEFMPKMIRKLKASKELYDKILGAIDTPQKSEAHRLTMAQDERRHMKDSNSQECRNCHNFEYMDITAQKSATAKAHDRVVKDEQICIDCHKGMTHKLPDMRKVEPGF